MKKTILKIFTFVLAVFAAFLLVSFKKSDSVGTNLSFVEDIPTIQGFTKDKVAQADLEKIVTAGINSPTIVLNGANKVECKKELGIPEDMNAKAVLLIGKYDKSKIDAVTGATTRKDKNEVATFIQ